jgi:hypothetical protein
VLLNGTVEFTKRQTLERALQREHGKRQKAKGKRQKAQSKHLSQEPTECRHIREGHGETGPALVHSGPLGAPLFNAHTASSGPALSRRHHRS